MNNNPTTFTDPWGLKEKSMVKVNSFGEKALGVMGDIGEGLGNAVDSVMDTMDMIQPPTYAHAGATLGAVGVCATTATTCGSSAVFGTVSALMPGGQVITLPVLTFSATQCTAMAASCTVTVGLGAETIAMLQNDLNKGKSQNYSESRGNGNGGTNSPKFDNDNGTILTNTSDYTRTNKTYQGARIYKDKKGNYIYRDNLHKDHLEMFDKNGKHLGELDPVTGELRLGTVDTSKVLPKSNR